jgi:hypothetical protein
MLLFMHGVAHPLALNGITSARATAKHVVAIYHLRAEIDRAAVPSHHLRESTTKAPTAAGDQLDRCSLSRPR